MKLLRLRLQLKEIRKKIKELREKKADFDSRNAALESALDTAETDEDLDLINKQLEELEGEEKEANVEQLPDLEAEAERIEGEISELEKKSNDALNGNGSSETPPAEDEKKRTNKEVFHMKNKRTVLGRLSFEERSAFLNNDEVKNWLERTRSFKGQTRAVSGAELTIPTVALGLIREMVFEYSKLLKHVNLKVINGAGRQTVMGAVPEAIWTEATAAINEISFTFGMVEVDQFKVGAFIVIPNSTLEDSDENLAEILLDAIAIAIGKAVDKAIVYGSGVKMPTGIVTRLAQTAKPADWSDNNPEWIDLHETNLIKIDADSLTGAKFFAELGKALGTIENKHSVTSGIVWCMSRKTHIDIMSKALAFNSAAALVSAEKNTMPFIGGDIEEIDGIFADGDIVGGYGKLYLAAERKGTTLTLSEHVKFFEDQTAFKGTARYDGKPVDGAAFVAVNYKNQAPATTAASDVVATSEEE